MLVRIMSRINTVKMTMVNKDIKIISTTNPNTKNKILVRVRLMVKIRVMVRILAPTGSRAIGTRLNKIIVNMATGMIINNMIKGKFENENSANNWMIYVYTLL